jgi:uncharacterized protein YbjT (DUF2867 family)
MTSLLILGATGLVGQQILKSALSDPSVAAVIAPTRRPLAPHEKLNNPIVDFDHLPSDAEWWKADIALCALGSTMKQAGSRAAFYAIDHTIVMQAARCLKKAGTSIFVLNSSLGASEQASSFYLRTKGEVEADLMACGFASLGIVRPSLLDGGPRPEKRYGEEFAIAVARLLGNLLPKKYRPISTQKVAKAMLLLAKQANAGVTILESDGLH